MCLYYGVSVSNSFGLLPFGSSPVLCFTVTCLAWLVFRAMKRGFLVKQPKAKPKPPPAPRDSPLDMPLGWSDSRQRRQGPYPTYPVATGESQFYPEGFQGPVVADQDRDMLFNITADRQDAPAPSASGTEATAPRSLASMPDGAPVRPSRTTVYGPLYLFRERIRVAGDPAPIAALVLMAGLPEVPLEPVWETEVLSDVNLQMWCEWRSAFPSEAAALMARRPDICLYHHRPWDPVAHAANNPSGLPQVSCTEANCARCIQGKSGYRFAWVSSLWTPHMARGATWDRWMGADCSARGNYDPDNLSPHVRRQWIWDSSWPLGVACGPADPFVAARRRNSGSASSQAA